MFENKYNDSCASLANLALKLTDLDESVIAKAKREGGEGALLKLISENCKPIVTAAEVIALIEEVVTGFVAAAVAGFVTAEQVAEMIEDTIHPGTDPEE